MYAYKAKYGTVSCSYLVRKIDRPRSIYSKTINCTARKDLQLDQLRRHSIWNYLVTDSIVHPCDWHDCVVGNETNPCIWFISKLQVYKPKVTRYYFCSVDYTYEKTIHPWIIMLLFHALAMFRDLSDIIAIHSTFHFFLFYTHLICCLCLI